MTIPKFLIGDHSAHEDAIFVIHTEFPRFIIDLTKEPLLFMMQKLQNTKTDK